MINKTTVKTLHEAIEHLIKKNNRPMTASEIALELNRTRLYTKRDGSDIKSSQIDARVGNYKKLFSIEGSQIGLKEGELKAGGANKPSVIVAQREKGKHTLKIDNPALAIKVLLNAKNFKSASSVQNIIPEQPGLYAIRLMRPNAFPKTYAKLLEERKQSLLYVGVAEKSLHDSLLLEAIQGEPYGRFFRHVGSVLGYEPEPGSQKGDEPSYTFSSTDETKIREWIKRNVRVHWLCLDENWEFIETQMIIDEHPFLNIKKNPTPLEELEDLLKRNMKKGK